MTAVIQTEGATKHYGTTVAVKNLSLEVEEGEVYAFVGLNGAGKTTLIRMLLGMVKPTRGAVHVLESRVRVGTNEPWDRVGYLVETPHAYPGMTVLENLELLRRLRGGVEPGAVERVLELLKLTQYADRRAGALSRGNRQRLGLARALLHEPKLLILDEPMNGLDPAGIVEIRGLLRRLVEVEGVTIFFSSHILDEVSRLADRIGVIHRGQLIEELGEEELKRHQKRRLVVRTHSNEAACKVLRQAGFSPELSQGVSISIEDEAGLSHPEVIATALVQAGHPPTHLAVEEEGLEQYFLRLVDMEGAELDEQS